MGINYIAVLIAAVAAFLLGFVWYSLLFGKQWRKLIGMKEDTDAAPPNMAVLLAGSFAIELVMAFTLAGFIGVNADWLDGAIAGFFVGFSWVGLALAISYMFEGKSWKLWLINAGYNTVLFVLMGTIIGYF